MTLLVLIALALLLLAGALFFGPYFIAYGPDGFRDIVRRGDARMIGLFLVAAVILALPLPGGDVALISSL